jgi:hypothetical protein
MSPFHTDHVPLARAALVAALLFITHAVGATTTRVDDSGTVVSQGVVSMRWKQLVPGRGADHSVEASLRVALRLNLARLQNQPLRLYMALAPAAGEPIYTTWRTQGRLLPGSLRSGGRALVFEGVVNSLVLEETLDLTLRTDGRALVSTQSLQFYFEADTP